MQASVLDGFAFDPFSFQQLILDSDKTPQLTPQTTGILGALMGALGPVISFIKAGCRDFHLHLGLQQQPGQRVHGNFAPRHHGRFSERVPARSLARRCRDDELRRVVDVLGVGARFRRVRVAACCLHARPTGLPGAALSRAAHTASQGEALETNLTARHWPWPKPGPVAVGHAPVPSTCHCYL